MFVLQLVISIAQVAYYGGEVHSLQITASEILFDGSGRNCYLGTIDK